MYIPEADKLASFLGDFKNKKYNIHIIVNNELYIWKDSRVAADRNTSGHYKLVFSSRPEVMNR